MTAIPINRIIIIIKCDIMLHRIESYHTIYIIQYKHYCTTFLTQCYILFYFIYILDFIPNF